MHDTLAGYIDNAAGIRAAMAGASAPSRGDVNSPGDVTPASQVIIDLAGDGTGATSTVSVRATAEGRAQATGRRTGPAVLAARLRRA